MAKRLQTLHLDSLFCTIIYKVQPIWLHFFCKHDKYHCFALIYGVYLYHTNKQKLKIMKNATITNTINKVNAQPKEYSLGFRRLTVLPIRVRKNINLACILKGESNNNSMKEFLNTLTEQEYINWLRIV